MFKAGIYMTVNLWHNIRVKQLCGIVVILVFGALSASSCMPSSLSCSSAPETTPVSTGPCHADFYAESTSLTSAGYANFTSTSTGSINTFRWDFGNGRTGVGAKARSYYNSNAYYTVTLTIEGPDCYDVCTKVDYIEVSGC